MKNLTQWLRACLGIGLAVIIFRKFDLQILQGIDIDKLMYASLAIQPVAMVGLIIHSMRLGLLAGLPVSSIRRPFFALLLSQGFNLVLPGRIAEFFKATYLHTYADVPFSRGMAAIVLERSVDLLIVSGLGLLGIVLLSNSHGEVGIGLGLFVIAVLILIPLLEKHLNTLANHIPWPKVQKFVREFLGHVSEAIQGAVFYRALALGIATWAASFVNIYLFTTIAGSKPIGFEGVLVLFVATTLGGAVPVLPGGFGSYEAAAILVLKSYGYNLDEALPFAIGMHLAQFVLPVLGGAIIFAQQRIGVTALLHQLRREAQGSVGKNMEERR